jgi:hypothetical protein
LLSGHDLLEPREALFVEALKLAEARTRIEARAKERFKREQAEYQAKLLAREAKAAATSRNPGGKPLVVPMAGSCPVDQINLTYEASRIMPIPAFGHAWRAPGRKQREAASSLSLSLLIRALVVGVVLPAPRVVGTC